MKNFLFSVLVLALLCAPAAAQQGRQAPPSQDDLADRPKIDVESYSVDVLLEPENHRLIGKADIRFKQLDRKTYAVFDLDRRLRVAFVNVGGAEARFRQFDVDSTVEIELSNQQFSSSPVVHVEYAGVLNPEEGRREPVLARVSDDSAFLLYEGKWFPTNGLLNDKADMKLKVAAPEGWTLVTDLAKSGDGFASSEPSYWGTVTAGKYTTTDVKSEKAQISVHTIKAKPEAIAPMAEAVGKVLDYYTEKFGPPPSSSLRVVEVEGANWTSQWSVGTLLLPSSQFRKDFDTADLATALAHQWFPLKVGVKDPSADAWMVDGMSVFAGLLYLEKTLSPAEAQEHIHRALVKALSYEGNTSVRQAGGFEKDSAEYHALVQYKGAYVFRMLRWVIGDESFDKFLARYVQEFQNTPASTEAVEKLASEAAGGDLNYFFDQWINSSGVPEFTVDYAVVRQRNGYAIRGQVKQDLDLFQMPVEFQVQTDGEPEYARVNVVGESSEFDVKVERKPKLVLIDPREKVLRMSSDIKVAVLINRGEELSNQGQFNSAIDEFQRAIDIDGHNSLAMFRLAEALFELGNIQAAATQFQEALNGDLKPKWVEVWSYINRGKIYDIRGQRERAVTEYEKAVNTGDDAYGAQAEAEKYKKEPFRRQGRPTIG
ncbi:MAG: tetratricopeptide repeat protein [Acidobacteria bacterium]|nr:tetratricopeptide repeat protein [Acidobacteriota bacterium]